MYLRKAVTDNVRSVSIVTKQSIDNNLLTEMFILVIMILGPLRLCDEKIHRFNQNEVLQMNHPHFNTKTVDQ